MLVGIRASGFVLTPALKEHAARRLQFALSQIRGHVRSVVVRLYDASGASCGNGKGCRIRVQLKEWGEVITDEIERDHHFAIDRAADRMGRAVLRAASRRDKAP
ncbi:MAG: HPF/RaiA family ribosome-associated protein [Burkholderiales bacterium]